MRPLALAFLLLISLVAAAQAPFVERPAVERMDPPFWWVGMEHPELQVMVYGPDVGRTRVTMDGRPGVRLERVVEVENPNYAFLYLQIADEAEPGTLTFRFAHADTTLTRDFELRARDTTRTYAQGFSSEDVIYLMMPDRFASGSAANDSIFGFLESADRADPNARHGGDFLGVMERLDYIESLGMTSIWFTPVFENNMTADYGAYHGYAATDMYAVDPRLGTNEEFLELVRRCHGRGLKVIMDMIHNHIGDRHWWMDDLPTGDWVHDLSRYGQTNYRGSASIDPYASEYDRGKLLNGWFVPEMPDLNQDNDLLATYLLQNTIWWIEHSGIDGIRMDTYVYPDKEYMARWVQHVLAEFPDFNIVGESWMQTVPHEAYWQGGARVAGDGYDSHLPSVTDFPMQSAIHDAFTQEFGWTSGVMRLYYLLAQDHLYPEPNRLVTFLDNHDMIRFFTQVGEDEAAFKMAYAFLMTTRGIPQVYYGTELMMPNGDPALGDGSKRADLPGGWPGDARSIFTEEGRTDREDRAFDYVQALTQWRKGKGVIHHGRLTQFIPENDTYVYFRHDGAETVMVVLNAAQEPRALVLDRFRERLLDYTQGRDVISGEVYALEDTLAVPARTSLVLELSP